MMNIEIIEGCPTLEILNEIVSLENICFGNNMHSIDTINHEFQNYSNYISIFAKEGEKYVGFKIGYERKKGQFYSWIGGVHPEFRGKGIARTLMKHNMIY